MTSFLKAYQRILQKFPLTCQSLQTGILMGTGDIIAQKFIPHDANEKFSYLRVAQFVGVGTLLVGPALATWYKVLSKYIGESGSGNTVVLKKLALDQLCFAPSFTVIFLSALNFVQGKTFDETKSQIKRDYVDILINNYKVWPAFQLVNFYFVPLQYQVLVVQFVALFWNAYISWKTRAPDKS